MDPIGDFITERCNLGADLRERTIKLFADYKQWSDQEGVPVEERVANETQFGTLLTQRGIEVKKTRGVKVRLQIGLKQQKEPEPAPAGPEASPGESQAGTPRDEAGLPAEQECASGANQSNGPSVETVEAEALAAEKSSNNETTGEEEDENLFGNEGGFSEGNDDDEEPLSSEEHPYLKRGLPAPNLRKNGTPPRRS